MLHTTQNQRTAQVIADSSIFSFSDYLQLACMTRRSVRLQAVADGKVIGGVVIVEGEVWHAWHRHTEGPEAFRRVVLTESTVNVVPHRGVAPQRTVEGNWERLLMDAAVAHDEQQAGEQSVDQAPARRAVNTNWFDATPPARTERAAAQPWAWGDPPGNARQAVLDSAPQSLDNPPFESTGTPATRLAAGIALCSLLVVGAIVSAHVLLGSDEPTSDSKVPRSGPKAQPEASEKVDVQALSPMPPTGVTQRAGSQAVPSAPVDSQGSSDPIAPRSVHGPRLGAPALP